MKIQELINNNEFSFNPHFKIYKYVQSEVGSEEEGESILEYDSDCKDDVSWEIMMSDITAINQAEDGTVEIEHF